MLIYYYFCLCKLLTFKIMKSRFIYDPSPDSPPSYSPELSILYLGLSENNKTIFRKIYRFLFDVVCPYSRFIRFGGVLYSYWLTDLLRQKYKLNTAELSLLTFIYHISSSGRKYIHSNHVYSGYVATNLTRQGKQSYLTKLRSKGYIKRSHNSPDHPYFYHQNVREKVFIKLTPVSIYLIQDIEKELRSILMRTSLDELAGKTHKKSLFLI